MCAAPASSSESNPSWAGSIGSPEQFRVILEETLYDARRFADAYPAASIYQAIASFLDQLLRLTADLHRPTPEEKSRFESMMPGVRSQSDQANPRLLQRFDAIWAYVMEWPFLPPRSHNPQDGEIADDANFPLIAAVDALIVAIHRLRRSLKKSRIAMNDQVKGGMILAQTMQAALRSAEEELDTLLSLLKNWVETGIVGADHESRPDVLMTIPEFLAHYLPDHGGQVMQIRRSFAAWRQRPSIVSESVEASSFEQFVTAIHRARFEASELKKLAPDQPTLKKLGDTVDRLRSPISNWIMELEAPDDRNTAIDQALSEDLDLLPWQQLPNVLKGVRTLADMLVNWTAEALPFFRHTLYETAIDLNLLQIASATLGLVDVSRGVQQLLYCTADGKTPPPHERREIELGDYYRRELSIYTSPALPSFLSRLRGIDAFWKRWNPPVRKAKSAESDKRVKSPPPFLNRHDAEQTAQLAVQQGRVAWTVPDVRDADRDGAVYDPIAQARGMTQDYFLHLLNSSIRTIDVLPMKFAFSRPLAMQLRAIRRTVDRGRKPTAEEQQTIGRGFAELARIVPGAKGSANNTLLNEAWSAHLYFQLIPESAGEQAPDAPAGMVGSPEEFKIMLADLLSDTACLMVLIPNSDVWVDAYRQLERLNQRANYGRELTKEQLADVSRALEEITPPLAELFANVPAFSSGFVDRAGQIVNYAIGRRIRTRAAFDELLRVVLAKTPEILDGQNWDDDKPRLAAIDRQLRAMRRWTVGGRNPTAGERDASRSALGDVAKLRGIDRMREWTERISELAAAFCDDLPAASSVTATISREIASVEAFGLLLNECLRDCRSLGGGGALFHKPSGSELIWSEVARQLAVIRRMLDQARVPTRRERDEIHRIITGIDSAATSPCPAIHDFLQDITERLGRVDAYYAWLVTGGPYAGKETGAVDESGVRCVSIGEEMRVAFVRAGESDPGIYVSRAEKICAKDRVGEIEIDVMKYVPTTRDLIRIVACDGSLPSEIRWNAHSDFLAWKIGGKAPQVGWAATRSAGEKGRVAADAFAWSTCGENFIAIDLISRSIFRINADNGQRKDFAALPEEAAPEVVPQISIAPGGECLSYTYGRADRSIDLCLLEFAGATPVSRVRKRFPGAKGVLPFWSRDGRIGVLVTYAENSTQDIFTFASSEGEAERLYHGDAPAAEVAPAWSSTGKFIAFFHSQPNSQAQLGMLDCDTREFIALAQPGTVRGRLTFGEETISVEGVDGATIFWPHVSHERVAIEKF